MAVVTVRNIPDATKEALRIKAARSGVSLEQYIRTLLQKASLEDTNQNRNIMEIAAEYFVDSASRPGDNELELPSRRSKRASVDFDK